MKPLEQRLLIFALLLTGACTIRLMDLNPKYERTAIGVLNWTLGCAYGALFLGKNNSSVALDSGEEKRQDLPVD